MSAMLTHPQWRALLVARSASFAVGVRGAIAEFHWASGDAVEHDDGGLELATGRGALAIRLRGDEGLAPLGAGGDHGPRTGATACWLPAPLARQYGARGLAELGDDERAVRPGDRGQRLFDLGLGLGHVRACVRTGDGALVSLLRRHAGEDVLAHGHPAMSAIKAQSPHRVFESASARIEVFQPIPSRARGERTPDGPHTHVLPALIGTADAALARLPPGTVPVLTVYPGR